MTFTVESSIRDGEGEDRGASTLLETSLPWAELSLLAAADQRSRDALDVARRTLDATQQSAEVTAKAAEATVAATQLTAATSKWMRQMEERRRLEDILRLMETIILLVRRRYNIDLRTQIVSPSDETAAEPLQAALVQLGVLVRALPEHDLPVVEAISQLGSIGE